MNCLDCGTPVLGRARCVKHQREYNRKMINKKRRDLLVYNRIHELAGSDRRHSQHRDRNKTYQ